MDFLNFFEGILLVEGVVHGAISPIEIIPYKKIFM